MNRCAVVVWACFVVGCSSTLDVAQPLSLDVRIAADQDTVEPGRPLWFQLLQADDNAADLSFVWSSDCDGWFFDETAQHAVFTAQPNASSECTFFVVATDGRGGVGSDALTLPTVSPSETGRGLYVVASMATQQVPAGQGRTFRVEVGWWDAPLTYAWSASAGTIAHVESFAGESSATWTVPEAPGPHEIRCVISDGEATTTYFIVAPGGVVE